MKHPTGSRRPRSRGELLAALEVVLRKVSAQSVLLSDTVAKLVGHNPTDLECLDLLSLADATTAGQLAARTGLTTGAITAVIDRLERAGFVRRRRDPGDRRRVLVEALPRALHRIQPLYDPLASRMAQLNGEYNQEQLGIVVEYLSRASEVCAGHVAWLQAHSPTRARRRSAGRSTAGRPGRRGRLEKRTLDATNR